MVIGIVIYRDNQCSSPHINITIPPHQQYPQKQQLLDKQIINEYNSIPYDSIPYMTPQSPYEMVREYDYQTLNNPLVAPRKRHDFEIPTVSIPTRGIVGSYKKLGILTDKTADNNDKYKFLFLMGRQKYPNSSYFDYYVTEKDSHGNGVLKFNIPNIHKELYTGDTITIPELGDKIYTLTEDKQLEYEYSPYLF